MKLIFTGNFEELKKKLSSLEIIWDETQPNKKVFRLNEGIFNWYENTGTIQFQGKDEGRSQLETRVKNILYPTEFPTVNLVSSVQNINPKSESNECANQSELDEAQLYLTGQFNNSEIVIGIVSPVGSELTRVTKYLNERLSRFEYNVKEIRISSLLNSKSIKGEYNRIRHLMKLGDDLREKTKNNGILAYGAAKLIAECRDTENHKRAYILNSLKHPEEVEVLRKIYGQGFYLFGIHADKMRRLDCLTKDKGLTTQEAIELTEIDEDEKIAHGQRTRDTFHLSDFFINVGKNEDQIKNTIQRFLELIFSHPYKNPTFDEFAMFMAFSSSVRSGDLSRQVGAVISKKQQIISTGANECPSSGGGLYWAEIENETGNVIDKVGGKDYTRSEDSNKAEQKDIIQNVISSIKDINILDEEGIKSIQSILERSRIRDLTEFGRVVHAEMEAILSCSRAGINCENATLYCTTFPCHNCAKHIIAAGIKRVVYVEPYPKSKALEFHSDSILLKTKLDTPAETNQVVFEPFTGVGARRFLDFFSMSLGVGNKLKRKDNDGLTISWKQENARIRVALLPKSYLDVEGKAAEIFNNC